ncbi:MAG: hypothetical protein P4M14_12990 [Gammaproteobacteria bacterium]|nr:hypothetical protein [Gammaproteobacteria bacterium]
MLRNSTTTQFYSAFAALKENINDDTYGELLRRLTSAFNQLQADRQTLEAYGKAIIKLMTDKKAERGLAEGQRDALTEFYVVFGEKAPSPNSPTPDQSKEAVHANRQFKP